MSSQIFLNSVNYKSITRPIFNCLLAYNYKYARQNSASFLGIKVVHNKKEIFISQSNHAKDILKKFGIENCILVTTTVKRDKNLVGSLKY